MAIKLMWLALAGAGGTVCRYLLHRASQDWLSRLVVAGFPWGTLVVNTLGCFVFGLVWALAEPHGGRTLLSPEVRLIVLAGFLGAFTTFSTFGFETGMLLEQQHVGRALANVAAQVVAGTALALAGVWVGKAVAGA